MSIRDNSFLVEEAYNQPQGVVQHIFNWIPAWDRDRGVRTRTFEFVFTQEWPVGSELHQFSYTIPLQSFSEQAAGEPQVEGRGLGDMLLNYRLQVFDGENDAFAFAPRFSLILPTGDPDEGLGHDRVGYQINLPMSKEFDRWIIHFNAGLTVIPDVHVGVDPQWLFEGRALNGYNLGLSVIRVVRPNFHLMLEAVCYWDEELLPDGSEDHINQVLISPGFRWAPLTRGDTQWVLGFGLPIGLSRDADNIGAIFYMSYEHRFWPKRE